MADPDRTEDWQREGLAGAVPDPPGTPERAAAARGRARRARRRTAIVAAAGVAATLAVVGVVSTSLRDGSAGDDTASAPASPSDVPGCPEKPVDAQTQVGPDHVPDGAVSVRLCNGDAVPIDVPRDALITKVDDVAEAVNGLEIAAPDRACTQELGPGFQLVFAYPDGTSVVASGGLYGCREVVVHGVERAGADIPWELFIERLRAQRDQLDPPPLPTAPAACEARYGTPTPTPLGRPQDLAVAVLCTDRGEAGRRAEISEQDLATLLTDLSTRSVANAGYLDCGATPPFPRIEGLTAWGDRVSLQAECGNGWFTVDSATNTVWEPGPDAAVVIERLVAEAD